MYTSVHSYAGALIMVALPNEIGLALVYLSHLPIDILQEKYYGSTFKTIVIEGFLHAILLFFVLFNRHWHYLIIGIILANCFDLVDKLIISKIFKEEKMICHQPNFPAIKISDLLYKVGLIIFYLLVLFIIYKTSIMPKFVGMLQAYFMLKNI